MKTIDFHTHLLSPELSFNRIYDKIALKLFAKKLGTSEEELLNGKFNGFLTSLERNIRSSQYIEKIVLLPVDGKYNNKGVFLEKDNTVCSSTEDILNTYEKNKDIFVPFLSINPNREDALDKLDEYIEKGCKGVKFLQNYWDIDINDSKYIPYFEKVKSYDLPIIVHTGSEYAVSSNSMYEKVEVINQAVEIGCKVVIAHMGVSMFMEKNHLKFHNNFSYNKMCEDYYKTINYLEKNDNVYTDLSAIISIFRSKIIKDLAENQKHLHNKLLFATDFPVPFSILFSHHNLSLSKRLELEKIQNPFDRYVQFLNQWFSEDSEIYTNYKKLI